MRYQRTKLQNPPIPPFSKGGKGGFTLVEYILVIALSGILFLALSQIVIITIRSWDIALAGTNLIGQAEVGFSRMTREIRQVRNKTSLITATSSNIRFIDMNNDDIKYELSGDQLLRNNTVAMDNVDGLSFEYFDKNSNVIEAPLVSPEYTNVRMVRVTLTTTSSTQSMTVQSSVKLRNVR